MRSDKELKRAVEQWWEITFQNWNGDVVYEGPANGSFEEEDRIYELLDKAEIKVVWKDQ